MAHKMNVESFNLDHTKVAAPFVRVADVKHLPAGDTLTKYDVRFCQPNKEHLEMPCLLYTSPSPRDGLLSRMPSSA